MLKKVICGLASVVIVAGLMSGCEWTAGGSADTWNDAGNWVDFSGTYKSSKGGPLVQEFGPATTNIIQTYTNVVESEDLGTGDGVTTIFSGNLSNEPRPGSITILSGAYRFNDSSVNSAADTATLTVTPNDGTTGTINYRTRRWVLAFPAPLASGTSIQASYLTIESITNPDINQGNHGSAIYSFVFYQQGNKIQIIDSNGASYDGQISAVRTSGGAQPGNPAEANTTPVPTTGPVDAQFSASGISQGYKVTIVGSLQGTLSSANMFVGRTMRATFIEENGYQADIVGVAPDSSTAVVTQ